LLTRLYNFSELTFTLNEDPNLSVVFVEGIRDLVFWRKLVPVSERMNSVIYSIDSIEIECDAGGNKGRLIALAIKLNSAGFGERVKFFVDADYDHFIKKQHPSNVIITDYRDIEGYAFNEETIGEVVLTGLAKQKDIKSIIGSLIDLCFPIGVLRLLSELESLELPFNQTFKNKGRSKIIKKNGTYQIIDTQALISKLLQNAKISLNKLAGLQDDFEELLAKEKSTDCRLIIHGKDWGFYLSFLCDVEKIQIEPLIFLALDYQRLRKEKNISIVIDFLTTS
jgi:hypothetical protein